MTWRRARGYGRRCSLASTATGLSIATILMVIASYYVLFAAVGAGSRVVIVESVVAGAFLLVAVIGFKTSLSLVAATLVGHAVFDACITSLSRTQGCRVGGRAFVSRSMSSLAASWLCR